MTELTCPACEAPRGAVVLTRSTIESLTYQVAGRDDRDGTIRVDELDVEQEDTITNHWCCGRCSHTWPAVNGTYRLVQLEDHER